MPARTLLLPSNELVPSVILRKLAAAGAGNALSRALRALGRIERTQFTLQWLSDPALLSLITAAIVHWNTVYLNRAVRQLRARGAAISDDLLAHVAPLGWEHIDLTGDYVWTASGPDAPFRPIRDVRATFPPLAA
jgi:hypothetical protein